MGELVESDGRGLKGKVDNGPLPRGEGGERSEPGEGSVLKNPNTRSVLRPVDANNSDSTSPPSSAMLHFGIRVKRNYTEPWKGALCAAELNRLRKNSTVP